MGIELGLWVSGWRPEHRAIEETELAEFCEWSNVMGVGEREAECLLIDGQAE